MPPTVRAGRPAAWLDNVARDLRHSVRLLGKAPAFALAAISILGLGIGANVAVFALVDLLLLQPPAGSEQPGELVGLYSHDPKTPDSYRRFSYAEYTDIRDHADLFSQVVAHRSIGVILTDTDTARRVEAEETTGNYFAALGVRLAAGRSFTGGEERPGSSAAVAVISHEAWKALGGSPSVLGRTILLNSRVFTVVGIAPAGFSGTTVAFGPMLWIPIGAHDVLSDDGSAAASAVRGEVGRALLLAGRLKPGVSRDAANAALRGLSQRLGREPGDEARHVLTVSRLARTEEGTEPRDDSGLVAPLGTLTGLAVVLLLVASLNVANMQLARGTNRQKELAMRLALGAGRARLVGQLMTEGLVLALAGAAAGLVTGVWALKALVISFTPRIDQATAITVAPDIRTVLAAVGFSVLSAVVFALGPACRLSRMSLSPVLKGAGGDAAGDRVTRFGPRHLVVAGQVALSLALLAAAGLFVRAALAAGDADPGYRLEGQLLARVDASGHDEARGQQLFQRIVDRVRAMPAVQSASLASLVAFNNESSSRRVRRPGAARDARAEGGDRGIVALDYSIGATYFRTLGLRLLKGREFTAAEERNGATSRAVIIDEPLAEALFPAEDPVGRRIEVVATRGGAASEPLEIVGVAPGLRHRLTDRGPVPHVYLPLGEHYQPRLNIHLRLTPGDDARSAATLRGLRETLRAIDPTLAVLGVSTLEEMRDSSPTTWLVRTAGRAFGLLGGIALGMAVIGLYSVKAYLVARRTREIGIRMALGATPGSVIAMILREGAVLVGAGLLVGFLLAIAAGQVVSSLLVGVRPLDPLVLFVATAILTLAVVVASLVPARRATRVDPAVALRTE